MPVGRDGNVRDMEFVGGALVVLLVIVLVVAVLKLIVWLAVLAAVAIVAIALWHRFGSSLKDSDMTSTTVDSS